MFKRRFRPSGFALLLLLLSAAAPAAAPLVSGVYPYQIIPFDQYYARIPFAVEGPGPLSAEVLNTDSGRVVASGSWEIDPTAPALNGAVEDPKVTVRTSSTRLFIEKVPINDRGDYTIRFKRATEVFEVEHVLVGEIWAVGGGVNAFGAPGRPSGPVSPLLRCWRDNRWVQASDPLLPPYEALEDGQTLVTPWLRAAEIYTRLTGIPVGLLGWAYPGLPIAAFREAPEGDLPAYKALLSGPGLRASRFFWFHGEADAAPAAIAAYGPALRELAAALRSYSANPALQMVVCQLPQYRYPTPPPPTPYFGRVRDVQRRFCLADSNALLIPTLNFPVRDTSRLSIDGVNALGTRLGEILVEGKEKKQLLWQGPRAASASFVDETRRSILVQFDNAERLVLSANAARDWSVTDARHQGYGEILTSEIKDGVLTLEMGGGRSGRLLSQPGEKTVRVELADAGFVEVMRVATLGALALRLELGEPAEPGARVGYGLWDDCTGSLRDTEGRFAAAFDGLEVGPPKTQ